MLGGGPCSRACIPGRPRRTSTAPPETPTVDPSSAVMCRRNGDSRSSAPPPSEPGCISQKPRASTQSARPPRMDWGPQIQRGGPGGAVVADADDRDAGHSQFGKGALAAGGVTGDVTDEAPPDLGVVHIRHRQRLGARFPRHVGIVPVSRRPGFEFGHPDADDENSCSCPRGPLPAGDTSLVCRYGASAVQWPPVRLVAAIKAIPEHPELELAGCWVHSKDKAVARTLGKSSVPPRLVDRHRHVTRSRCGRRCRGLRQPRCCPMPIEVAGAAARPGKNAVSPVGWSYPSETGEAPLRRRRR